MVDLGDQETAERVGRSRALTLTLLGGLFLMQQLSNFVSEARHPERPVDYVRAVVWLVTSVVMVVIVATNFWFGRPEVGPLINDEVTRAHRAEALRFGFLATMIACFCLYPVTLFEPLSGRHAIHLVMSVGIAAALVRFGLLERRALADE
ncbi:MAG: hypothetical protein JO013_03485 [Alphaproteobacteria bacterium]|nr:hypothetical protein [Alphaproteobacteria bacterium]